MKQICLLLMLLGSVLSVGAQQFDDDFEDRTLRLDYVFAGDNRTQHNNCRRRLAGLGARVG